MEITPDKRKLNKIVEDAYEGKICLPDFQRSFVWERDNVADLIRSILRGYYIGSLLLLVTDPENPPFRPEHLTGSKYGANGGSEPKPFSLLLDGQQRITSLLYALTESTHNLKDTKEPYRFFIDLNKLIEDPFDDDIVFFAPVSDFADFPQDQFKLSQYQNRWLPCTTLLEDNGFLIWRDDFDDYLEENEPENRQEFKQVYRGAWTTAINQFQNYQVGVVELPRIDDSNPDEIGRVCAIFEKMNSTGVDLTAYDLLTARLYRHDIRLHDLWAEACSDNELLAKWSDGEADNDKFGLQILRVIALLRGKKPTPRDIVNLTHEELLDEELSILKKQLTESELRQRILADFRRAWKRAAQAIERAMEILTNTGEDGFAVFDRKWLPGIALISALAAIRAQIEDLKLTDKPREDLRRWYWCNIFMGRYSSAVESKSYKDYTELSRYWLEDGPEPDVFQLARNTIGSQEFTIRDSATQSAVIYKGVFCLLAQRGAKDWRRNEDNQLQILQDHHIFPKNYLGKYGIKGRKIRNTIVNRTLISDETNRKIRDKAPSDYVDSDDVFSQGIDAVAEAHFFNEKAIEAMRLAEAWDPSADEATDNVMIAYENFLDAREEYLISEIRRVCDISPRDIINSDSE